MKYNEIDNKMGSFPFVFLIDNKYFYLLMVWHFLSKF